MEVQEIVNNVLFKRKWVFIVTQKEIGKFTGTGYIVHSKMEYEN
jgi:hypothetical protein